MRALFGTQDVTDVVQKTKSPFEVNIRLFGDPQPGVYKFLKITQDNESVLVGEGDIVWQLKDTVLQPPACRVLASLDKFVRGKKGLCLQNITSTPIPAIVSKQASSVQWIQDLEELDDIKLDTYDFVFCSDLLLCVPNPIALLCQLHAALREGGYCILSLPIATQPSSSPKATSMQFDNFLSMFDAKLANEHITASHAASNESCDFNVLRAMLRFALLIPQYAQRHEERQVIVARKLTVVPSPQAGVATKFFDKSQFPSDVMFCPHCGEMFCKDDRCSFVYCGLGGEDVFRVGFGCGRSFCYTCGKKYCGEHYDATNGQRLASFRENHDAVCCTLEAGFQQNEYCGGGHSTHCSRRW